MSTGRTVLKELYVGFLLFLLTFLYLSHLNRKMIAHSGQEPAKAKQALKMNKLIRS